MTGESANSAEALGSAKKSLRQRVLSARAAIDGSARAAACVAITGNLVRLQPYRRAQTVGAYHSFGSEFDTAAFIADVLRTGRRLALPRIDRAARSLVFHFVSDLDAQLVPGSWGIREPDPARCAIVDLHEVEFMLVPGVAFTRDGDRLGYGGGFYDRVLERLRPDCRRVAAAFSVQVVDSLPMGPNDRKVDAVITEAGDYGFADQSQGNPGKSETRRHERNEREE